MDRRLLRQRKLAGARRHTGTLLAHWTLDTVSAHCAKPLFPFRLAIQLLLLLLLHIKVIWCIYCSRNLGVTLGTVNSSGKGGRKRVWPSACASVPTAVHLEIAPNGAAWRAGARPLHRRWRAAAPAFAAPPTLLCLFPSLPRCVIIAYTGTQR